MIEQQPGFMKGKIMKYRKSPLILRCCMSLYMAGAAISNYGQQVSIARLKFTDEEAGLPSFKYNTTSDPYLIRLHKEYKLNEVVTGAKSDYEKVRRISRWVRSRWEHNGDNEPQKSDPLSILQEAAGGKRFRCVEYSIVLSGALNSLGIPARVTGLMVPRAETQESGAGHVIAEAYLADLQKWIMVDGQWDVIPVLNDKPLNAVELQRALVEATPGLTLYSFSGTQPQEYFAWVAPYLFYFDTKVDSRIGVERQPYSRHSEALMLVPIGAKEPRVFQGKWPLKNMQYTHSLRVFYAKPT